MHIGQRVQEEYLNKRRMEIARERGVANKHLVCRMPGVNACILMPPLIPPFAACPMVVDVDGIRFLRRLPGLTACVSPCPWYFCPRQPGVCCVPWLLMFAGILSLKCAGESHPLRFTPVFLATDWASEASDGRVPPERAPAQVAAILEED